MKRLPLIALSALLLGAPSIYAGLLPTARLDPSAVRIFDETVNRFEADSGAPFTRAGTMWIDQQDTNRKTDLLAGKSHTETLPAVSVPGGQINHLFGFVRIPNTTLETVLQTMQNYSRYPDYFKPDIANGSSTEAPDSTKQSKHFEVFLKMVQSTAWIDVAFDSSYDTRYILLDGKRAVGTSRSKYIREYRDAHNQAEGTLPEGSDHGFLWRTYTSWHFRERDGGVELELNSFSLTRAVPMGFGWWASRTARNAVDKMINSTAQAIRRNSVNSSD